MLEALTRIPLRLAVTGVHGLHGFWLRLAGRERLGVHAVPVTPRGTVVLVKLRYARGWRLPGGGRGAGEDPREAALRELREEIGLTAYGAVEPVIALDGSVEFASEAGDLFVVRDVEYSPHWSLEVEAVTEARPDRLPPDLSDTARHWLASALRSAA